MKFIQNESIFGNKIFCMVLKVNIFLCVPAAKGCVYLFVGQKSKKVIEDLKKPLINGNGMRRKKILSI